MKYEDVTKSLGERLRVKEERVRKRVLIPLALIAGAVLLFALFVLTKPTVEPVPPKERSWTVAAVPVLFEDITPQQQLFGQVVAGRETELRALVAGSIIETGENFREGGIVRAGELLVQIDPFDYQAALDDARARLREAKARLQAETEGLKIDKQQLEIAERDLERARTLHEKGTVAKAFLDNAERTFNTAQWAVSSRTGNVEIQASQVQQREVALRRAERDLRDTKLVAPFDGYVRELAAELGKRVGINDRIAVMSGSERLEVKFNISDAQYGRILAVDEAIVGRPVTVNWNVGGAPISYPGSVVRTGAQIEAQSGGVEIYAALDVPPGAAAVRPGAFVEVTFPDRHFENVARLPERALFDGDKVYAVVDNRLTARRVEVVGYAGDSVFVRGEIVAGDEIMTTRLAEIGEGILVDIRQPGDLD